MHDGRWYLESTRVSICQLGRSKIGSDNDAIAGHPAAHLLEQPGHCREMLYRNGEESLQRGDVKVQSDHPVDPCRADQVSNQPGANRLAPARAAIVPRVAEIRHHGGHGRRSRPATRIGEQEQLEEPFLDWRPGGLDQVHIVAPHGFLDLDAQLSVGKPVDVTVAQGNIKCVSDALGQRRIGTPGNQLEGACSLEQATSQPPAGPSVRKFVRIDKSR